MKKIILLFSLFALSMNAQNIAVRNNTTTSPGRMEDFITFSPGNQISNSRVVMYKDTNEYVWLIKAMKFANFTSARYDGRPSSIIFTDANGYLKKSTKDSLFLPWFNILNKPNFSTVATSGSYLDLLNKPMIPTYTAGYGEMMMGSAPNYTLATDTNEIITKDFAISKMNSMSADINSKSDKSLILTINGTSQNLSANRSWTITESSFLASPASAITSTQINNWNTAFGWGNHNTMGYVTASSTNTFTNKSGNISMWNNNAGYITASSSDLLSNKSGNVSMWTNDLNYITPNSSNTLTNKSGNISMWNNDAGYALSSNFNSSFDTRFSSKTTDNLTEGATNKYFSVTLVRNSVSAVSPLIYSPSTGSFSIQQSNNSQAGYLSAADWNTFNAKQAQISGTGFAKFTGTTVTFDNSAYVPTSRNITVNGTIQALSSDASFTIPIPTASNTTLSLNGSMLTAMPGGSTVNLGALASAKVSFTFSGITLQTTYTITHNLGYTPSTIITQAKSAAAAERSFISSITSTNFVITFITVPVIGTNNIIMDCLFFR